MPNSLLEHGHLEEDRRVLRRVRSSDDVSPFHRQGLALKVLPHKIRFFMDEGRRLGSADVSSTISGGSASILVSGCSDLDCQLKVWFYMKFFT